MGKNQRVWFRLFAVLLCSFTLVGLLSQTKPDHSDITAKKGELHLEKWNLDQDGPIDLNGEWEMYWGRLLTPDSFTGGIPLQPSYMSLPASWNSSGYPAEGYATFRLRIHWDAIPQVIALHFVSVASSHVVWVDGVQAGSMGQVGTSEADSVPENAPVYYVVQPKSKSTEIVVQVANFDHRRGGIWESVELSTPKQMHDLSLRRLAMDLILFGSLFMMAIYHLILYTMRRRDRSTLYFGLFCLIVSVRTLLLGESFLYSLIPELGWEIRLRLEYWGAFLGVPIFAMFIRELYPDETSKLVTRTLAFAGVALSVITAFTAPIFFTKLIYVYQPILILSGLYSFAAILRATVRLRYGAGLAATGVAIYVFSLVNDILYFNEVIKTGSYSPFGLFAFIALHSAVLSMKFSRALTSEEHFSQQLAQQAQEVQQLNERLQEMNRGLEATIAERTHELRRSNRHLAQKAAELGQMDDARRQLLSNISHELRTPMTSIRGYVEALLDDVIVKPDERRHYLQLILNKMIGLNRLIADLFELSKLESGQPDLLFHSVPLTAFLARTRQKYEMDIVSSGMVFVWNDSALAEVPPHACVVLDPERIDQVLTNFVSNAIRCTPAGGSVGFSFATRAGTRGEEQVQELLVQVEDTGKGIDEDELPLLFDRFYQGHKEAAGGSGLGLAIAKEIVTHHGGSIWAMPREEGGSTFGFSLLLYVDEEEELM
ncbi:ATP-binding protein [Paenibacillus chartarius]|uniref:histidine kinase n=1 Tax=Paenibacillus chartarius TaxID=747481 RepID=A0ABV6DKD6_9BACL